MHHQRLILLLLEGITNRTRRGASPQSVSLSTSVFLLLTSVTSLSLGLVSQADASTGVHDGGLFDDETIPLQTGDVAAGVGESNFIGLVGIQPDFALSALEDGGREALLETKIDCKKRK